MHYQNNGVLWPQLHRIVFCHFLVTSFRMVSPTIQVSRAYCFAYSGIKSMPINLHFIDAVTTWSSLVNVFINWPLLKKLLLIIYEWLGFIIELHSYRKASEIAPLIKTETEKERMFHSGKGSIPTWRKPWTEKWKQVEAYPGHTHYNLKKQTCEQPYTRNW